MKAWVTMNEKEQRRAQILNQVQRGELTGQGAAELLGLTLRQTRRLLAAYRAVGVEALAHGNRGRSPAHTVSQEVRERVVDLTRTTYAGCNQQHLTELLAEREQLRLSRSTVRRILQAVGLTSPRVRRAPKHRSRRERYPQEGQLLQIDASRHDWLAGRGPWLTLIGGIDDATGKVPHALFREAEDTHGYFHLLQEILRTHGRPLALYHDRHGIFERSLREQPETLAEQLAGERSPTQFGRLLQELEIGSIPARSPQAKGRIERLWGTFQDRLVSELRLAGASSLAEANALLAEFLPRFDARFAVPPAVEGVAYRPLPVGLALERVCCFKYLRTVAADNTVRLGEHCLQLLPGPDRLSYARLEVEVHERLDGSLAVYHQDQCLATRPAPAEAPVLRARGGKRAGATTDQELTWTEVHRRLRAAQGPASRERIRPRIGR